MQKSESYYRRKELMETLQVPNMSEVKQQLGEKLASVVFQECPDALKEDMGLVPKLKGAGPNLWVSPSDLLIGKVCLKPPLTDKHIKALTHEGILAIGYDIELKYWNEMEMAKKKALEEQEKYLKTIGERVKRVAIKMARDEDKAECERRLNTLSTEFENRLKEELDRLEQEMLEHQAKVVEAAVRECAGEWAMKMEIKTQETVEKLTKQFLADLEKQKAELEQNFRNEFERQQKVFDHVLEKEHEHCKITIQQMQHCLECKNLANLMYVLCMERRKCSIERSAMEFRSKTRSDDLHKTIADHEEHIQKLIEENDSKQKQLEVREKCVLEILKQFQKFINYALRATPTQAEFLLDVKKMMMFEITQAMVEQSKEKAPRLAEQILPWTSDSESTWSTVEEEGTSLTLPDYHACLDEIIPPAQESDFLASFYYKDKLYVNKQLELLARKGMDVSETNVIWNRDVQNLMQLLKASVNKKESVEGKDVPCEKSVSSTALNTDYSPTNYHEGARKSVLKHSQEKIDQAVVYCNLSGSNAGKLEPVDTSTFIKKIIRASLDVQIEPLDTTGLLAARDSLTVIRESRRSSLDNGMVVEMETNNTLMAVKETLESSTEGESREYNEGGSVNFENLDAIMMPDQLEIKKSAKSSKVSIIESNVRKPTKSSLGTMAKRESILHTTATSTPAPPQLSPVNIGDPRESKLLTVKDSLIIHRNSIVPSAIHRLMEGEPSIGSKRGSITSRLSMARDSLELLRKQSIVSKCSKMQQTEPTLMAQPDSSHISRRISPLTVSRIEIAKIPALVPETSINFSPIQEVYEDNVMKTSDSPWKIYEERQPSRDNFLTKPNELRIAGNPQSKEHLIGSPSFTAHRINSIMNILRKDASLMRLFTSGTK